MVEWKSAKIVTIGTNKFIMLTKPWIKGYRPSVKYILIGESNK